MVDPLKLQGYIEAIAGKEIPLSPFDPLDRLPLYLCGYSFLAGEFDGVPYLFACVEKQELTPTQYLNQWEKLQNVLSAKVIFVFETLPAIKRNRFFQLHIPFIVPDSQFYLPPGINFSERQKRQVAIGEFLSYPAQLLVIREILFQDVSGAIQKELAVKTGYTSMSISSAIENLEQFGLCRVEKKWKERLAYFQLQGKELWKKALPLMRSPVRKKAYISSIPENLPLSGISALSQLSMISPDPLPVYAISFTDKNRKYILSKVASEDIADCLLEVWQYKPLEMPENRVDPLSLYLSMKDEDDPRIQGCLQEMMENIKW